MLNIARELKKLAESSIYATSDLSNGYWKQHIHLYFLECKSILAPDSIYTTTHVLY